MRYPARYLFVFLEHHGMLSVFGSPTWRTVVGGSATYVEAIAMRLARSRRGPARACRCNAYPTACSSQSEAAEAAAVRRRGHRHASRPGAADARRADGRRTHGSRRDSLLAPTTPSCTPTSRCCRGTVGPARRGTIWSHPTATTCWSPTTSPG